MLPNQKTSRHILRICAILLLFSMLVFTAVWTRVQNRDSIPNGQFTETDAYFYYWQAQIISEHGRLPERDMHRWLPYGRDLNQTLNLYSYVLAYVYKALALGWPNISLYDVALYAPTVCFVLGLGALCVFLFRPFGVLFSSTVGLLLATLPGTIERSAAGFSDRDSWCLMLGILAIITYLVSLQVKHSRQQLLWTFASGITVFFGGLSWEGFGVFLIVILCVELWKFLTSETEEGLGYYFIWILIFVPTLYFFSFAYRNGEGFAKHISALMLIPPLVIFCLRFLRYLLLTKIPLLKKHLPSAQILALILTLVGLALAIGYILSQFDTFVETTVPFSQNRLMQSVTELQTPNFKYWLFRYGSIFLLSSLGLILYWRKLSRLFLLPLVMFVLATFFREPLDRLCGVSFGNIFFYIAIASCTIGFILILVWRQKTHSPHQLVLIAFTSWFLTWVALTRDAKRYDFFMGIPLAFFTAQFIQFISGTLIEKFQPKLKRYALHIYIKNTVPIFLLILFMFFPPILAHTYRSHYSATQMRRAIPGNSSLAKAFQWMKAELPPNAVVAAHWRYGSQLNVLGGVKTITDQDHYIQHWIHLYMQHVLFTHSEREVLEFLKTHGATHLMLTKGEPKKTGLRGKLSDAWEPVYPTTNFKEADIKVWKIHYPPGIETNAKYLATDPKE